MTGAVPATITLYTAPGCPDCAALKQWLRTEGYPYVEKDLSAPGIADEAKRRYGVRVAPITVIGAQALYGTFAHQRPELERALGRR